MSPMEGVFYSLNSMWAKMLEKFLCFRIPRLQVRFIDQCPPELIKQRVQNYSESLFCCCYSCVSFHYYFWGPRGFFSGKSLLSLVVFRAVRKGSTVTLCKQRQGQVGWCTDVLPTPRRQRQLNPGRFKAHLSIQ